MGSGHDRLRADGRWRDDPAGIDPGDGGRTGPGAMAGFVVVLVLWVVVGAVAPELLRILADIGRWAGGGA